MKLVLKVSKENFNPDFTEFGKSIKELPKIKTRELSTQEKVVAKELFEKYGDHTQILSEDLEKLESARIAGLNKEETTEEFNTLMEIAKNMKFDTPALSISSFNIKWSIKKD